MIYLVLCRFEVKSWGSNLQSLFKVELFDFYLKQQKQKWSSLLFQGDQLIEVTAKMCCTLGGVSFIVVSCSLTDKMIKYGGLYHRSFVQGSSGSQNGSFCLIDHTVYGHQGVAGCGRQKGAGQRFFFFMVFKSGVSWSQVLSSGF